MIKQVLDILALDDFYNCGKNIDIAKGIYKIPMTTKEAIDQVNRKRYAKRNSA